MDQVTLEAHGAVLVMRYRNPPRGFMNSAGANAMLSAFNRAAADANVRVIVITGESGVFIRHYDVAELVQVSEALTDGLITPRQFDHAPFVDLTDQIAAAPKPVIAAINGVCMGGGFELALACDIRIAGADVAEIGLPETRLGIFPGGGGTQRLPRLVGEAKALELILTGRIMNAAAAEKLGLVHSTAPDALDAALAMAASMAALPAAGLAAAKKLIRASGDVTAADGLIAERRAFADLLKTDEAARERMRRFVAEGAALRDAT